MICFRFNIKSMQEEKERAPKSAKKKKYVYLERYEQNASITEARLDHLESMNMLHWAVEIIIIVGLVIKYTLMH